MSVVTIRDYSYYENLVPLCFREDQSFMSHFQMWYELAYISTQRYNGIIGSADTYLALLNIFNANYESILKTIPVGESETYDILNKLFEFFNLNTSISITIANEIVVVDLSEDIESQIIYLRANIIKSFCNGTLEQELEFYELCELNIDISWSADNPAFAIYSYETTNENLYYLFMAGELHINHIGIIYELDGVYSSSKTSLRWASSNSDYTVVRTYGKSTNDEISSDTDSEASTISTDSDSETNTDDDTSTDSDNYYGYWYSRDSIYENTESNATSSTYLLYNGDLQTADLEVSAFSISLSTNNSLYITVSEADVSNLIQEYKWWYTDSNHTALYFKRNSIAASFSPIIEFTVTSNYYSIGLFIASSVKFDSSTYILLDGSNASYYEYGQDSSGYYIYNISSSTTEVSYSFFLSGTIQIVCGQTNIDFYVYDGQYILSNQLNDVNGYETESMLIENVVYDISCIKQKNSNVVVDDTAYLSALKLYNDLTNLYGVSITIVPSSSSGKTLIISETYDSEDDDGNITYTYSTETVTGKYKYRLNLPVNCNRYYVSLEDTDTSSLTWFRNAIAYTSDDDDDE